MKIKQLHFGVTLVELIVVLAIIAMMAAAFFVVRRPVEDKAKIEQTKATIQLLCAALEQYHQFYNHFPFETDDDYDESDLKSDIGGSASITVEGDGVHEPDYSSCEALYYFLNQLPDSQSIINSINSKLLTNKTTSGGKIFIIVNSVKYPLIRIVDGWGNALRYECKKNENWNFPVITSAGQDGNFGDTDIKYKKDNITSEK